MYYDESFLDYYEQYKELIDRCIPKEVLERLLKKAKEEKIRRGDQGDENKCPF